MLAELAELDLALARHVQARALASEDAAQVADLSRAYQRISRCVRQTLALKAKLKREAEQHVRWLAARDVRPRTPAPAPADRDAERRAELEEAVGRVIWAEREFEGPDWEDRQARRFQLMEHYLHVHHRKDRFGRGTLDEDVITLCGDLGLSRLNALNWRKLPEPEFEDEDEEDDEPRRSSG
jgi:hypothetical protein